MLDGKRKRTAVFLITIGLNTALVLGVIHSVFSAFNDAERVSFAQNIENVRTLTNASANKVELELNHHVQEISVVADYVNNYNGVGMTEEELEAYFTACFSKQDAFRWQLAENELNNATTIAKQGFNAVTLGDGKSESFSYPTPAYPELAKIFVACGESTIGEIQYTSEFTDASSELAKSTAITTTLRIRCINENSGEYEYKYKTLMLMLKSSYINELISDNNDIDSMRYYNFSNIVVDDEGNYVISNEYFQATNFIDFIRLYNDDFSEADEQAIEIGLKTEDYSNVFYFQNNKDQSCAYTIVPVQNSNWHILSIVPLASFHDGNSFNGSFVMFALLFAALFALDITVVLIINRRLRRATKKAKEANESKSLFLSSMSHDIRTPMNAIVGMTLIENMLLDEQPINREAIRDCVRSIELSGNHLLTLINDILDISKIESGKIVLHPSDFSIAETLSETIEMCQSMIVDKSLEFNAYVKNVTSEYIDGDSLRVKQIFINILSNAVKYTASGGKVTIELTEEAIPEDTEHARYVYKVIDNGIGMTPEFVKTIFERFTRAVDTRINAVQGTGLGMTIVKQLVDLMGGKIEVQSELNVGSTFTVTLDMPFAKKQAQELHYLKIPTLIISDDLDLLETAQEALQNAGAAADIAQSASQGIKLAVARHKLMCGYNVIFVDWKPEIAKGGVTIKKLRSELGDSVHIVVMTAFNTAETQREARRCGGDYFITKPLFMSKLISSVEQVMQSMNSDKHTDNETFPDIQVFIAEDNDTNWRVFNKLLKFYGINATRAINGLEIAEMVEKSDVIPDLIFMDIQMPVMNGYEATRTIRAIADKKRAEVPIYAMTADTFAEDIAKCAEAGMDGHFAKPIDMKKVLDIIRKLSQNKHENMAGGNKNGQED